MDHRKPVPLSPRPELEHFAPYKPGTSIQEIRRQYGLTKITKLASNENSLGPSSKALQAYRKAGDGLFRYPESRSVDLRRAIAEKHKRDLGEVIIGAGSDEIIELLAKTYLTPQDNIVVSASSFIQYRLAAALMGAGVITVPMRDLKHDLSAMAAAVNDRTKLLFIANPNNPTGTYNTRSEADRFFAELPERVLPVFDEAYFEYAAVHEDYPSVIEDYFAKKQVVILRTFSKIYGLAGLRVGYAIAPEWCVSEMDKIRPPFNVSVPAQAAAQAALGDSAHIRKSVALNEREKAVVSEALTEMGFEVVPSAANFLLFRVFPKSGRVVYDQLLQKAVIARSVDEYGLPEYLRITIGDKSENKIFLQALREVLIKP